MATPQNPHQTPSRRALGDLTPRAMNSPSTHARNVESSEAIQARSPLKKVTSHIPSIFAEKENSMPSTISPQGRKRGIEEVEDVEKPSSPKMIAQGRDETLWDSGMRLTTAAMQRHTENNPIGLADPGSPTERNTPTPEPEATQNSQKSNQSFSDFLNYELCASQKSEHAAAESAPALVPAPALAPAFVPAPTSVPGSAPTPESKKSRAELLRTRLKFGLYKVKTKQESVQGKDIISSFEASSSPPSAGVPNITISSPRRDMPVFVKANLDPFRPIGKLGQPPVQFAIPGDSPPSTTYDTRLVEHNDAETAESARQRLQRLKDESFRAGSMTNSAVKGNAAVGLLELMSGRR